MTRPAEPDLITAIRGLVLGNRYELDTSIAVGGMGQVWLATDVVLGRRVAVKLLRSDLSKRPGFLGRFRREARNLAMLSHPTIATLFDYGEHDGTPYLVMELVSGENLAERLHRDGPMQVDDVVDIVRQVATGLAAAHEAGMVHRDIKPANLMITDRGLVKITDFGISRLADAPSLTATTEVMGTPQYMSPEQITGLPTSPTSDVYSLGVVAFEMLTGRPPFSAESPVTVALAQVHDLPPPLPGTVPPWLATFIGRSLAKNPADRPHDGQAVVAELSQSHDSDLEDASQLFAPTVALPRDTTSEATRAMPPHTRVVPTTAMSPDDIARAADVAAAGGGLIGPLRRHRTKRLTSIGLSALAVIALVTAIVLARPDGSDSVGTVDPSVASTAPPATAATSVATTDPAPSILVTTTVPTVPTVVVDPAEFVGREQNRVVDELTALGLEVEVRSVDAPRGTAKRTVMGIAPSGELTPGTVVEVQVFEPEKGKRDPDD